MLIDGSEKISFSLALSELVLDDAKVKILLISLHFLLIVWLCPLPAHSLTSLCFVILKVFRWYTSGPSFIYVWFVVLEFWNFKCFHTSRNYNVRLLRGGFLDVTHWNMVKFVWNLTSDALHCNASGILRFYFILKKNLKLSQKIDFLGHFERFWFMPSYALWVTPQSSAKSNVLRRCIIVVSFISVAFVVVKL